MLIREVKAVKTYSNNLDIYKYEDYRSYLKDATESARVVHQDFSFRNFSKSAGFTSPNFLILLMNGKRNLSDDGSKKIAKAFGLKDRDLDFFCSLVQYNQAKDSVQKYSYASELIKLKSLKGLYFIEEAQFSYYSSWINIAIRELLTLDPSLSAEEIAFRLSPRTTTLEVETAFKGLIKIGLIHKSKSGHEVVQKTISTGTGFQSAAVSEFHRRVLQLASESIDRHPRDNRDLTATTIVLSRAGFEKARDKIQALRHELLALPEAESTLAIQESQKTSEVYQLNFQIFPLTKKNLAL